MGMDITFIGRKKAHTISASNENVAGKAKKNTNPQKKPSNQHKLDLNWIVFYF